jgi:hypothetical protein
MCVRIQLSAALAVNTILTELKLFDCAIEAPGTDVLLKGLKLNRSLQEVDLSFNTICDDGGETLARLLESQYSSSLTSLKLCHCGIQTRGALALAVGVRHGPLRASPLVLYGVPLAPVAPKLNLPQLPGGWNTQKILAFFHHELGGVISENHSAPVVTIGKTKEQVEAEAKAIADELANKQLASRNAAKKYREESVALAKAKQVGKDQESAAKLLTDAAAAASVVAATLLLTPEMIKEFENWNQAFERDFLEINGISYQQWQDSVIDVNKVIP